VDLTGADLTFADLTGADLRAADLTGADLTMANLTEVNLEGADLGRANLTKANLTRANLEDSTLALADLTGANIYGACLQVTSFNGTKGLYQTNFDGVEYDTQKFASDRAWPKGLDVGTARRKNDDWIRGLNDLQVDELYYLAPLANLDSILTNGILSHGEIERRGLQHLDISLQSVQRRRQDRDLHDRVPFYFAPRTPMSSLLRNRNHELCLLVVNVHNLCRGAEEISFTDGNAASGTTRCYVEAAELEDRLPLDAIRAQFWTDTAIVDGKRKRSAEFLVAPAVSATAIKHIVVPSQEGIPAVASAIECAWSTHPYGLGGWPPRYFVDPESFFDEPF
jgi:hypothetical protein